MLIHFVRNDRFCGSGRVRRPPDGPGEGHRVSDYNDFVNLVLSLSLTHTAQHRFVSLLGGGDGWGRALIQIWKGIPVGLG